MNKDELEEFKNKNIKIILKDDYHYNGNIISLSEDTLKFNDRYVGTVLILFENIKLVRQNSGDFQ